MAILNLENKRLLVVEDDDMSFLYINQLLLLTKASFVREKSGSDAVEQFRNNPGFDLILMDIQLPDMDGKEVTSIIRTIDPHIPIVAQTASRSTYEHDLILAAGCTSILTKPFSMDDFYGMVGRYIGI